MLTYVPKDNVKNKNDQVRNESNREKSKSTLVATTLDNLT